MFGMVGWNEWKELNLMPDGKINKEECDNWHCSLRMKEERKNKQLMILNRFDLIDGWRLKMIC